MLAGLLLVLDLGGGEVRDLLLLVGVVVGGVGVVVRAFARACGNLGAVGLARGGEGEGQGAQLVQCGALHSLDILT